jgi:hypothetical protein
MMVSLLFTGDGGAISGDLWLGLSMLGIIAPGVLALLVRWLRGGGAADVDRYMTNFLE